MAADNHANDDDTAYADTGDRNNHLRRFLSHLVLDCHRKYQNSSGGIWFDANDTNFPSGEAFITAAPEYLENAFLNEGFIDIKHLDESEAERKELYATVASTSMLADKLNASQISYCPVRFDGYLCWPKTPAGTVLSQNCPDFVEGFNEKFMAHKTCLENGSWYRHPLSGQEWSNYTNCIDYEDLEFRSFVNELYVKGYSLSLMALLLSLLIFCGFKSLRCTRIRIHVHLFASLALTCIAWILWYRMVVERPELIADNPNWCIFMHLLIHYLMLVNYFWMFCEGLHLHLVLVVVFVKDTVVMRWFMLLSWGSPLLLVVAYTFTRRLQASESNDNCWMNDSVLLWIFSVPICLSLWASFVFLVNVLRVIVRKLHPQSAQPAPLAIRKAVRATIILIPLFGLQHFLLPYRPDVGAPLERFYQILSVILVSLQGFVVSFLFCFVNQDVAFSIRALLHRFLPKLVAPPPAGSNTGQIATLTPSRELGV